MHNTLALGVHPIEPTSYKTCVELLCLTHFLVLRCMIASIGIVVMMVMKKNSKLFKVKFR